MDKRSGRRATLRGKRVALAVTAAFLPWGEAYALPTGEHGIVGDVTVTRPTTQTMQINQGTPKGIVNWQGFSIGATEHVNITQPNSSAALLNRVVGNSPSEIFGRLTANGQVFLVNNAGVLFAPGASVDVGSLFASSLSITDQNFLNGNYQFYNPGNAGSVVNQGSIVTAGGYTALVGPQVRNDGIIVAQRGSVVLAAGDRVSLDMIGDGLISVSVDQAALNASVINTGEINADGGTVALTARSANALLDTVVNAGGVIRANSLVERNGEIFLDGGSAGVVAVTGTLQAAGGTINVLGDKVGLLAGARVDASGNAGGGTVSTNATAVYVAADATVSADALQSGDGGRIVLWSSESTQIHGTVSARGAADGAGGFVETSGGYLDITRAPEVGAGGTWLIDPRNIEVVAGAGTSNNGGATEFTPTGDDSRIGADLIRDQLNAGTNVILDTGVDGSQEGNITFSAGVFKSALNSSSLQLNAADDVFVNAPIEMASGNFNVAAGGDMVVRSLANAMGGSMNIALGGDLSVLGTGAAAQLGAQTGQTITARSVEVTAQAGGSATLTNGSFFSAPPGGNQVITVTGGAPGTGLTVQTLAGGGAAFLTNFALSEQRIVATDADHIKVDGRAGNANISNPQGEQTISITGNRSNAIVIGSNGGTGRSIINGAAQTITAGNAGESGSITITGSAANGVTGSIVNLVVIPTSPSTPVSTQSVRTSGTLTIQGGTAPAQTASAGIFQNRPGQQTVSAANIVMQGGPSGSGNGAFINTSVGGDQLLTVPGEIRVIGGAGGTANRAGIVSTGSQTIDGNLNQKPNIVLAGGAGGGLGNASNNVFIQATGGETKPQTINAGTIQITAGAGTDASATLNSARQVITTTGDVSLFGSAGLGPVNGVRIGGIGGTTLGPTNLTLGVGGNLLLHAGTANGASLGSSGASTQANNITVTALGGNVTLESDGAGARIGSSGQVAVTPGNISVIAGGSLQLSNGTAVRANGPITLTANSLTNRGTITNGGGLNTANMILNANAFDLAGGNIQGGAAAVILRPRTGTNSFGIESAGATTLTNADIASINTSNFVVFGSGIGTTFTGNMVVGENAQVNGGTKSLAFFRSSSPTAPSGTVTIGAHGLTTTGDVIVGAGNGTIVGNSGGTVAGDEVQLRASQGIGAPGARVQTAANALAINTGGGAFVTEADDVTLRMVSLNVGGMQNTFTNSTGGTFDLATGGMLNVAGSVTSGVMNINAAGALAVAANTQDVAITSQTGQTINAYSLAVSGQNGFTASIVNNASGDQTIGVTVGPLDLQGSANVTNDALLGSQTILTPGTLSVLGGNVGNAGIFHNGTGEQKVSAGNIVVQGGSGANGTSALIASNNAAADQKITVAGGSIALTGGTVGDNNQAVIRSAGNQTIDGDPDITLAGGATSGPNGFNSAFILGNTANAIGKTQTINADTITLTSGSGGVSNGAALLAPTQIITTTGDVRLSGNATGGQIAGVRMGGLSAIAAGTNTPTNLTLDVGGDLVLTGGTVANNVALVGSTGGQPQAVRIETGGDVVLSSPLGSTARIGTGPIVTPGDITITAGRNILVNGGGEIVTGGALDLEAVGALNVSATSLTAGNARISSNTGQTIGAQSLSVTAQNGRLAQIVSNVSGNQTVTIANGIDVQTFVGGGTAEIRNNSAGAQTITVAGDHLNIKGLGGGFAGIVSGGNQTIAMTAGGPKQINLGDHAAQGRSSISSGGDQTITGDADITLTGGSGPIADGSNATIVVGNSSRLQKIEAGTLTLANSALGGNNSVAGIQAANQSIKTTGNVTLTANASGGNLPGVRIGGLGGTNPTTTNLTLDVGGDLVLTGGTLANNGVGIGSTAAASAPALANNIAIDAAGSVILNSGAVAGTGARIGSSATTGAAPGNITITADRDILLNGSAQPTVIRTLGMVTLDANHISAGANGFIIADTLNTTSNGSTTLTGPNQVANYSGVTRILGDLSLANNGGLTVTNLSAAGNARLTNSGDLTVSGPWNSFNTSITTTGAGSDLSVTNSVTSGGLMEVNVAGGVKVSASGAQNAMLRSVGGQTITARSLEVTAADGGFAAVSNTGPIAQTINVAGGTGVDVQTLSGGGFAQISADLGGSQTINVVDGDHINVNGANGGAGIFAIGGTQTLSITGSGANAITIGSAGALGPSNVGGGFVQNVTAGLTGEQGSITIVGPAVNDALAGFVSNPVIGGTQTVTTSGLISITGGTAPNQPNNFPSGIFHNGSGQQSITAAGISLTGGPSGRGNTAQIGSFGGGVPANAGHQVINVAGGTIALRGSDGGINNRAIIFSNVDQTINGDPDLFLTGGASAIAGTGSASINTALGRSQTIHAGSITLTNSPLANADSFAGITSSHQVITTTGDVVMTPGASAVNGGSARIGGAGGGATDLQLTVGGSLLMNGGDSLAGGVGIGSSGAGTAFANNINIAATEDVILNSGVNGVRIGSARATGTAGGNINISGRSIQLNGTSASAAIRTLDSVTLHADQPGGTITESGNAFILAGSLSTTSQGNTSLTGANQVANFHASSGGDVSLNNTGVLNVTGLIAAGDANINNIGDVNVSGPWTAGGTSSITVGSDILLNAAMVSPEVVLTASDGAIIQAETASIVADTLNTTSSGETRLVGANQVESFSATSSGELAFNNTSPTLTISNIETNGGAFSLTHIGDLNVTDTMAFATVNIGVSGSFGVLAGASPAEISAQGPINISAGGDLRVIGGSGDGAFARIHGYSDINLTVGGFLTINAGSGADAWARIQTASRDSVIRLHFPNLASGGYFVNDIEAALRRGHTGLLSGEGVAVPDHTLFITYGVSD
jgi:filamentous hemagglutinin family protein